MNMVISTLNGLKTNMNRVKVLIVVPDNNLLEQVARTFEKFTEFIDISYCTYSNGKVENKKHPNRNWSSTPVFITTCQSLQAISSKNLEYFSSINRFILYEPENRLSSPDFVSSIKNVLNVAPVTVSNTIYARRITHSLRNLLTTTIRVDGKSIRNSDLTSLYYKHLPRNPNVCIGRHYYFNVGNSHQKIEKLVSLIRQAGGRVLIYCESRDTVSEVFYNLENVFKNVFQVHNKIRRLSRLFNVQSFLAHSNSILVCTQSIFSFPLHANMGIVINFDIPKGLKFYPIRNGVVATINLVCRETKDLIYNVEDYHSIRIPALPNNSASKLRQ